MGKQEEWKCIEEQMASMRKENVEAEFPTLTKDICVVLTQRCNRACAFCLAANTREIVGDAFAPLENVSRAIEFANKNKLEVLNFTGGEPTLHPEFAIAVKKAKRAGLVVHVTTNYDFPQVLIDNDEFIDKIYFSNYDDYSILPKEKDFKHAKLQMRVIVHKERFPTIEYLDAFIDSHQNKPYTLHLITLRDANKWCQENVVPYIGDFEPFTSEGYDDRKGTFTTYYRGIKIHRYDLLRDPDRTDISYKVHVDGKISLNFPDEYLDLKDIKDKNLFMRARGIKNSETRKQMLAEAERHYPV